MRCDYAATGFYRWPLADDVENEQKEVAKLDRNRLAKDKKETNSNQRKKDKENETETDEDPEQEEKTEKKRKKKKRNQEVLAPSQKRGFFAIRSEKEREEREREERQDTST